MSKGTITLTSPEGAKQVLGLRGLPPAQMLIGAKFLYGDEEHFIGGIIKSIGYGSNEGVVLYISPQRFRGKSIRRLEESSEGMVAVSPEGEKIPGNFCLL